MPSTTACSSDPNGTVRDAEEELRADLGGRLPHLWVAGPAGRVSTIDLLGTGLTLFTGPENDRWRRAAAATAAGPPVAIHGVDELTARALGIRNGGALLVRPDGAPAAWWPTVADGADGLRRAIAATAAARWYRPV